MPRLLLLIPTTTYRTAEFFDAARTLGVELVVASNRDNALQGKLPSNFLTLDFDRPSEAARQTAEFAKEHPIDAVLGVDDPAIIPSVAIAEALGVRCNPLSAARATRDKYLMRCRLAEAGLPGPDFQRLARDQDPRNTAELLDYPVVLKPTDLGASRGVIRADDPTQMVAAFERIKPLLSSEQAILVESFIPGIELALEGLLVDGQLQVLALFDKPDPLNGPFFEETIYLTPSRLPQPAQQMLIDCARLSAAALGLRNGPVHAELRLNDQGAWLIEVAARTIGGLCSRTLRFGTGMSLEELVLRHVLDMEIPSLAVEAQPAGVMMIPVPRPGRFRQATGLDSAEALEHIEEITITAHPGQVLQPLPEGEHYLGFIFARANHLDAVEGALRSAHRELQFEFDPPD